MPALRMYQMTSEHVTKALDAHGFLVFTAKNHGNSRTMVPTFRRDAKMPHGFGGMYREHTISPGALQAWMPVQ